MVSADTAYRERFVVLDGMRGLAALAVVTDHIDSPFLTALIPGRYLAVDFFFVLSGFVLAHVYAQRLAGGMSALEFMRVRLIRLYPLYVFGLAAGVLLAALLVLRGWSDVSWAQIGATAGLGLFMLPTPTAISTSPYVIYPFDPPAWSLFFELVVNAAFALVFLRLGPRMMALIIAVSAIVLVWSGFHYERLHGGFSWENFAGGFPRVFFGFFVGVALHRLHLKRALPALPAWAAFLILLVVFAVPATGLARAWFDLAAAMIFFPALVALCARSPGEGALARGMGWLGLMSYGVYILHVPIRDWLDVALTVLHLNTLPGVVMALLVGGLAITATAVLDRVYDRPLRRWLTRRRNAAAR